MTTLTLPELSLVVLIGASGSGKSTFRARTFQADRGAVVGRLPRAGVRRRERPGGDRRRLRGAPLHRRQAAGGRAADGRGCHERPAGGAQAAGGTGAEYHCLPVAIVFDLPEKLCQERNRAAPDRDFGPHVIRRQAQQLRRSLRGLKREGFRHVFVLDSPEEVDAAVIERQPLWNNLQATSTARSTSSATCTAASTNWRSCWQQLGLRDRHGDARRRRASRHPPGPQGRLPGRPGGPRPARSPQVLQAGDGHGGGGSALCVPGNHDVKLHAQAARQGCADHARPGGVAGATRGRSRRSSAAQVGATSSTAWSATTCSMTASWWSPMPA